MKKILSLNQARKISRYMRDFEVIPKKTLIQKIRIVAGVTLISIEVMPNGLGIVCYPLGFLCLKIRKEDFLKIIENYKMIFLEKIRRKN